MTNHTVTQDTMAEIVVEFEGIQGPAGIVWRGEWAEGVEYLVRDAVYHNGSSYRCVEAHTSSEADEPGASDKWALLALGSDVQSVADVAAIRDEIVTVAGIKTEVEKVAARDADIGTVADRDADIGTVAGIASDVSDVAGIKAEISDVVAIKTDVSTVAARDADVATVAARDADIGAVAGIAADVTTVASKATEITTVAGKIPEIEAAPSAASTAQAWAEGTEPGGPGTKSAKEHAQDAGASASIAAGATLITYGVAIYNDTGIEAGGYYAERMAHVTSTQDYLYAEIIDGDPGSGASIVVLVGGDAVYGPVSVEQGTPLSVSSLGIAVSDTDDVAFMLTPSSGVREIFIKTYGAVTA